MPQSFTTLVFHIIFATHGRGPILDPEIRERLFPYMGGIVRELGGRPFVINGPADHVHLLAALPATVSVAEALRIVKANSSKWVHETFPKLGGFAWQAGYGAFTVSRSNEESVRRYIEDQEAHHRTMAFRE